VHTAMATRGVSNNIIHGHTQTLQPLSDERRRGHDTSLYQSNSAEEPDGGTYAGSRSSRSSLLSAGLTPSNSTHVACDEMQHNGIPLEGRRSVRQPKRHNEVLEVTVARAERSLPLVAALNRYSMVRILLVKNREMLSSPEAIKGFTNQRQRMPVLNGDGIQPSVINTSRREPSFLG